MNAERAGGAGGFRLGHEPVAGQGALRLEQLEERIAPAGAVTTAYSGGSLTITGDDASNDIVIDHEGLAAGQVRISSGADSTLIDGEDSRVLSGITKDIKVFLKGGDDRLEMASVDTPGNLVIDGGDGANTILLGKDAAWLNVGKNLTIKNGSGHDLLTLNISVMGALSVDTGAGGSTISLQGPAEKAISVKCGDGPDVINFRNMHTHGLVKIDTGNGGTDFDITNGVLPGGISFKGGEGWDDININGCDDGDKGIAIATGNGGSGIVLTNAGHGKITVKNGVGDSGMTLVSTNMTSLSYANGAGNTSVVLHDCGVDGSVAVKTAGGNASFTIEEGTYVGGKCTVTNGPGDTTTQLLDSTLEGTFSLKNVLGKDTVVLSGMTVAAPITIANGNGGSDITLYDSHLGITGPGDPVFDVKIKNGDGSDYLYGSIFLTGRDLSIDNGAGGSTAWLVDSTVGRDLKTLAKAGDDLVLFDNTDTVRGLTVDVGDGANTVMLDDGVFGGAVTIKTGAGADTVALDANGIPTGIPEQFNGPVKITTGLGDDVVRIGKGSDAWNACHFAGKLSVDGGAGGYDMIYMLNSNNTFALPYDPIGFEWEG